MIAFAAGQWANKLGADEVTILGRGEKKRKIAEAITGLNYDILENCNNEFDVVLEAVGSSQSINKAINKTKSGGTLVLMGNPEGDISFPQNTYWRILRKQLKVIGTWNSSYENGKECDWTEVRDALADGDIKASLLISHMFNHNNLKKGLNLMKEHKEPYCKVMISWGNE